MPTFQSSPEYEHGSPESLGVLVVNLGTPDDPSPGAVRRYLRQFLSDPRVGPGLDRPAAPGPRRRSVRSGGPRPRSRLVRVHAGLPGLLEAARRADVSGRFAIPNVDAGPLTVQAFGRLMPGEPLLLLGRADVTVSADAITAVDLQPRAGAER